MVRRSARSTFPSTNLTTGIPPTTFRLDRSYAESMSLQLWAKCHYPPSKLDLHGLRPPSLVICLFQDHMRPIHSQPSRVLNDGLPGLQVQDLHLAASSFLWVCPLRRPPHSCQLPIDFYSYLPPNPKGVLPPAESQRARRPPPFGIRACEARVQPGGNPSTASASVPNKPSPYLRPQLHTARPFRNLFNLLKPIRFAWVDASHDQPLKKLQDLQSTFETLTSSTPKQFLRAWKCYGLRRIPSTQLRPSFRRAHDMAGFTG